MPIEKGQDWGVPGVLDDDAPVLSSDADAARCIEANTAKTANTANTANSGNSAGPVVMGLDHGDLARTLGVPQSYDRSGPKQLLPVDVLEVQLDAGDPKLGVAHVVIGDLLRSSHAVAVMNAAFLGPLNLAPRAHPGDGKFDLVTLRLGLVDRFKAKRRMVTGTHVPHPGISIARKRSATLEFDRPRLVRIDGKPSGRVRSISIKIVPSAVIVAV